MKKKGFSCSLQCGFNCCSEVFFELNGSQRYTFENQGFFIIDKPKDVDWKYLSYHKAIKVEKLKKGLRKLTVAGQYERELKYNQYNDKWYLQIKDKCVMLKDDNKCKVYRDRPNACKVGLCPVFEDSKAENWFAVEGDLRPYYLKAQEKEQKDD